MTLKPWPDYESERERDAEWRPVVGYEGLYEVSDQGGFRRCDGRKACVREFRGVMVVSLSKPGRRRFGTTLARVVWAAFKGPLPKRFLVGYRDGDSRNASLNNLWARFRGGPTKLKPADALAIAEAWQRDPSWGSQTQLAHQYGVSPSLVNAIVRGKRWRRRLTMMRRHAALEVLRSQRKDAS